jgi:hypothetical protein
MVSFNMNLHLKKYLMFLQLKFYNNFLQKNPDTNLTLKMLQKGKVFANLNHRLK